MTRTTLKLDDALLRQLKQIAAADGRTLQAVANDLLRQALATPKRGEFKLKLRGWKARARPGVDILDRDKLFDLIDGR